ncbi:hypothetical protein EDD38_7681 [Kitasatospora cineracea]|uniref:Uncharacterized protein n=2 Tax=Kitasatospora cineracea TaxID=88074 RepID=A0A3N4R5F1_9ACTN|nr:hypothetical protein EDD38_7681 [Kitasatospora cineracea]
MGTVVLVAGGRVVEIDVRAAPEGLREELEAAVRGSVRPSPGLVARVGEWLAGAAG